MTRNSRLTALSGSLTRLRRRNSRSAGSSDSPNDGADASRAAAVDIEDRMETDEGKEDQDDQRVEQQDGGLQGRSASFHDSLQKRRLKSQNSASGMSSSDLRKTIRDVQTDASLSGTEKAKRVQELMTFSWRKSQVVEEGSMKRRAGSARSLRRYRSAGNVRAGSGLKNSAAGAGMMTNNNNNNNQDEDAQQQQHVHHMQDDDTDGDLNDEDVDVHTLRDGEEEDYIQCFHDEECTKFGCEHYERNCMISAPCCNEWFPCRFCHDEDADHEIDRYAVDRVRCMQCATEQGVTNKCVNESCGATFARYFCEPCKFYDNKADKQIYHCPECKICRIGEGLGIDYFHCKTCAACMSITLKDHKCVERSLESDCPCCSDYLFTSTTPVMFLPCGHSIHVSCYETYTTTNYVCPICSKSLGDMASFFSRIDEMLKTERMPKEYMGLRSRIFCSDCEERSIAPYHFIYHKCKGCGSYNTKVLEQLDRLASPPHSSTSLTNPQTLVASRPTASSVARGAAAAAEAAATTTTEAGAAAGAAATTVAASPSPAQGAAGRPRWR